MKRILLAIGSSDIGGGQRVFVSCVKEFINRGLKVSVAMPPGPLVRLFDPDEVEINIIDFRSLTRCLFPAAQLLKRGNFTLINCYLTKCSLALCLVNLLFGIPICSTLLNAVIHEKLNLLQRKIYPFLYLLISKLSNCIIVNSYENKHNLMKSARISARSISVIYSGIDIDEFDDATELNISEGIFTIGAIGRLSIEKGFEYLIHALIFLKGIDFQCLIVGDGPERSRLKDAVRIGGLESKVKFLGFQKRVARFMKGMHVVVVPSLNETFGITIVEAFAMKIPVIASSVGGIPELIEDGISGLLFPAKDYRALADRISFIYHNPDVTLRMTNTAHRSLREKFTSSVMAENTLALYRTISKHIT